MVQQAEFHGVTVPYLPAIQIECEAEALLSAFAKRFSAITEPPVPAQEIASQLLGLRIESLDLKRAFPDSEVHGAIWFRQRKVATDQSLDPRRAPANRFRYRFALAHELGHWQLHRRHYLENRDDSGRHFRFELLGSLAGGSALAEIYGMTGEPITQDLVLDPESIFQRLDEGDRGIAVKDCGQYWVIQAKCPQGEGDL